MSDEIGLCLRRHRCLLNFSGPAFGFYGSPRYPLAMNNKKTPPIDSAADVDAIRKLARRVLLSLTLLHSLNLIAVWCFLWGTAALVSRAVGGVRVGPLLWGALGILPATLAAASIARRQLPARVSLRALLDERNKCGGLLMAAEGANLGEWRKRIPEIELPRVRWRKARFWVLAAAVIFLLGALTLPLRFAALDPDPRLDLSREVKDLGDKIETLKEENLIETGKADALEQKLEELGKEASAADPAKTWEALDHLAGALEQTATEAANSELARQEKLAQAEALAEGLISGADDMDAKLMNEAMQTLAQKMERALQENQMLARDLSPALKEAIESGALRQDQLRELAQAISGNRSASERKLSKLSQSRLIDSKTMGKVQLRDNSGLSRFLQENGQRMSVEEAVAAWSAGRGGVSRGRADAALTWTEGTSEKNARFKEKELPPAAVADLKDSRLIGLSASEPAVKLSLAAHGALNEAARGGGSANTAAILPRHKGAVKRYFERK